MENVADDEIVRPNRGHPGHPVLKGKQSKMAALCRTFGLKDTDELRCAIDRFLDWVQKQPHFEEKDIDRDYLEAIFCNAKCSMEKAKRLLDKRMQYTNIMPELLTNFDVKNDFVEVQKFYKHALLPWPTDKSNSRIGVSKCSSKLFDCDMIQFFRYIVVTVEYQLLKDIASSHIVISDFRDLSMSDMFKFNISMLRKTKSLIVQAYGSRVEAVHLITGSKVYDSVLTILKPGFPRKIQDRIYWHNTPATLTDYISKDQLPSDYGGKAPSIDELHDTLYKDITECPQMALHLKRLENYKTNETKRIEYKADEKLGMQGSFRTLTID